MCNLYALMKARAEVAALARAMTDLNNNQPPMPGIYPDYAAPIITQGEDGQRIMRDARWGMPSSKEALFDAATLRADKLRAKGTEFDFAELLKMEPDKGTTNIRYAISKKTGKTNRHWAPWLGAGSRCLVPFTHFAEPHPEKGKGDDGLPKQAWFCLPDRPVGVFAGLWTETPRGRAYAFATCQPNEIVGAVHPKAMPAILKPEEWEAWLEGDAKTAKALIRPYDGPMDMQVTTPRLEVGGALDVLG